MLKQNGVEDRQEVRGDGSEAHEHCKEAASAAMSSIPITAGVSETFMEVQGDGSESHEHCKDPASSVISSSGPHEHCNEAASTVVSSTPITAGVLETFKVNGKVVYSFYSTYVQ